jgi:hypothetical protein
MHVHRGLATDWQPGEMGWHMLGEESTKVQWITFEDDMFYGRNSGMVGAR